MVEKQIISAGCNTYDAIMSLIPGRKHQERSGKLYDFSEM
jgi:hypothetical protein